MSTYDQFLYYVRPTKVEGQTLRLGIEICYYDPERFAGEGGMLFACSSELYVEDWHDWEIGDDDQAILKAQEWRIKVMQQGNSFVSIEDAEMRAEVNRQVLEMAHFIRHQLIMDATLEQISAFLKDALKSGEPVEKGFRYSGSTRTSLAAHTDESVIRSLV